MVHKIKTQVFLKIFSVFLFVLLLGAYASTFALFNGNPYAPGSTLDPECAPTDTNCKVLLTSGGSSPWLTGTSNIYHNGNVNVGSDTASVSTSIGGGSTLTTKTMGELTPYGMNMTPSVTINNEGNPVIVFYTSIQDSPAYNFIPKAYASRSNSSLNIIVCSDSNCNNSTSNIIDSDFYTSENFMPSVKIDSNNIPHITYMEGDNYNIKYAVCNDEECSDSTIESIVYGDNGYSPNYSLSLDGEGKPYIIYNSYNPDSGNYSVSIARYTGSGEENTCSYYYYNSDTDSSGYLANSNWKCTGVTPSSSNNILSQGGKGDYMYISPDGFPRFVSAAVLGEGNYFGIQYSECTDMDCSGIVQTTPIDSFSLGSYNMGVGFNLSVNSEGVPYIAYIVGSLNSGGEYRTFNDKSSLFNKFSFTSKAEASEASNPSIFIAYPDESGSGCSESSGWTCKQVASGYNGSQYDGYLYLDIEIGDDDIPRIVATKMSENDRSFIIDYIECANSACSSVAISNIFSDGSSPSTQYLSSQIALDESDQSYLAYFDIGNFELKLTKIGEAPGVSFGSGSSNLYAGGDLGITGNLFVDGSTALSGGLYFSNGTPGNTNNALYNSNGELYWGENILATEDYVSDIISTINVGPDLVLGTDYTTSGSLRIASQYGGSTTLRTYNNANYGNYGSPIITLPSSSGTLVTTTGSVSNSTNSTYSTYATQLSNSRLIYGAYFNGTSDLTGPVLPNYGGTGRNTLASGYLLAGNGTGSVNLIAPSTSGNVLTSNGTSWVSSALSIPTRTVAQGGTGLTTLTANNLMVGNGTSNVSFIAPSTSGNILTSNGTSWVSQASQWVTSGSNIYRSSGNVGIGISSPTAGLHLKAGTATAGTAPLKFTSSTGTLLSATEAGAMEFDGTHLYFTATNGGPRYQLDQQGGGLTVGTTAITSGISGRVLYNNSGTLGEMTTSGSGTTLALATSPVFTTPSLGVATATSINGIVLSTSAGATNFLAGDGTYKAVSAIGISLDNTNFNTKAGANAGLNLVTGAQYNTFLGYQAGMSASSGGTTVAGNNTAVGYRSLYSNTTGSSNTANGSNSLYFNTTGSSNTANGSNSLYFNTTGSSNTANGTGSLHNNTTGNLNTANGVQSLYYNTTGNLNTANGVYSLFANTTGSSNTANGTSSLHYNHTGSNNTANGRNSLYNISGLRNGSELIPGVSYTIISGGTDFIICGASSSASGTVFTHNGTPCSGGGGTASSNSNNNVAEGYQSGMYIADGSTVLTASLNSLFIGSDTKALIDGSQNEIVIGYNTTGNGSNTTTIGTGNVLYVGGSSISGKVARFTNSAGYCDINPLTTALVCSSDITLKKNITTLEKQTDLTLNKENVDFVLNQNIEIPDTILGKINLLTPVKYNWNTEEDTLSKHIGFIAQEVEQIFPDLVFTDKDTGLKSIAYSNLIPYTIKAIQEMDLKVKDLSSLDTESATSLGSLVRSFLEDEFNGIKSVFFGEVHTDMICVKRSDGTERCVTGDELDTVLGPEEYDDEDQASDTPQSGDEDYSSDTPQA